MNERARLFMWLGWIANFIGLVVLFTIRSLFPPFAVELGFTPRTTGLLVAAMPAAQLGVYWLLGSWNGWHYRLWPLATMQLVGAGGCLLAAFAHSPAVFAVGFVLAGFSIAMGFTSSLYYSVHGQKNKRRQAGIHEAVGGAGAIVGPVVLGAAATAWHPRAPYGLCALLLVALTIGQVVTILVATRGASSKREKAGV